MNRALSLLAVFLVLTLSATAQEIGTVTLVEGPLRMIRGATVLQGVEGARLRLGDIIESSNTGFAQLEFTGGAIVAPPNDQQAERFFRASSCNVWAIVTPGYRNMSSGRRAALAVRCSEDTPNRQRQPCS